MLTFSNKTSSERAQKSCLVAKTVQVSIRHRYEVNKQTAGRNLEAYICSHMKQLEMLSRFDMRIRKAKGHLVKLVRREELEQRKQAV